MNCAMDHYLDSFREFLLSERNYSQHTVKAYMTDVGEFVGVARQKKLIPGEGEEFDVRTLDEAPVRAYIGWLYTRTRRYRFRGSSLP